MGRELLVTVLGARRSGHLALDSETLVGDLTAEMAERYGSPGDGGLVLVRKDGTVLQSWMTLQDGRVSHGDELTLRTVAEAIAESSADYRRSRLWLRPG